MSSHIKKGQFLYWASDFLLNLKALYQKRNAQVCRILHKQTMQLIPVAKFIARTLTITRLINAKMT
jgi:hypothetical protein